MTAQICEIAQLGAKVLREISDPVDQVRSPEIRQVIHDMINTLTSTEGVGLAAPQISHLKRIIIVGSRPTARYPHAPLMTPVVMINPEFEPLSDVKEKDWEGCLSIPGIRALVPRYKIIKAHFTDRYGNEVEQVYEDFIARVYQHEADHLDGKVYLDRIETTLDIISESEYVKLFTQS